MSPKRWVWAGPARQRKGTLSRHYAGQRAALGRSPTTLGAFGGPLLHTGPMYKVNPLRAANGLFTVSITLVNQTSLCRPGGPYDLERLQIGRGHP
jgi:hypothetical protein